MRVRQSAVETDKSRSCINFLNYLPFKEMAERKDRVLPTGLRPRMEQTSLRIFRFFNVHSTLEPASATPGVACLNSWIINIGEIKERNAKTELLQLLFRLSLAHVALSRNW